MCLITSPDSKISKNESKTNQNSNEGLAPKGAIWHFSSVDWHKFRPRLKGI